MPFLHPPKAMVLSWGDFAHWRTSDSIWGHTWLSQLGRWAPDIQWVPAEDAAGHPMPTPHPALGRYPGGETSY